MVLYNPSNGIPYNPAVPKHSDIFSKIERGLVENVHTTFSIHAAQALQEF
jgi:hypothetical protein